MYEKLSERGIPCYPFKNSGATPELMLEESVTLIYARRSRDPREKKPISQLSEKEIEITLTLVTKIYREPVTHYAIPIFPKQKEEQKPDEYLEDLVNKITRGEIVLRHTQKQFHLELDYRRGIISNP